MPEYAITLKVTTISYVNKTMLALSDDTIQDAAAEMWAQEYKDDGMGNSKEVEITSILNIDTDQIIDIEG